MKHLADFIVFSDDYGRHPSSCQHLIKRFLPWNRVLWVNTVGLRKPTLSRYDLRRGFEKIKSWITPLRHVEKNLWVYSLFSLPWYQNKKIRDWNRSRGLGVLRKLIKKLNFKNIISLTTVPNACDWISELGEKLKIYYCVDDFSEWPGMDKNLILEMESKLLKKIDLMVPASETLLNRKQLSGKTTFLLPHGIDVDHFKNTYAPLRRVKRPYRWPCLGYFGLIDERLDFNLILSALKQRPGWTWVFLGPVMSCPKELQRLKNVVFLKAVPYEKLPQSICYFDFLMLPYKSTSLVEAINPLKLRECIATGKPVVVPSMPWSKDYKDLISEYKSPEEFVRIVDDYVQGIRKNNPESQWKRMSQESWETRAEALANEIEKVQRKRS